MDFKENTDKIFAIHSKTTAVIMSCKNLAHIEGATNYVDNLKRFCKIIKCNTDIQRNFLKTMVGNAETTLKIKRRSLQ